jgi:hypothetical protein
MAALDRDQRAAQVPRQAMETVPADVAARYLQELPMTWRKVDGGTGRRLLAGALFERIDVLGLQDATVYLTAHAARHGLAAVLPEAVGISVNGRGERSSGHTIQLSIRIEPRPIANILSVNSALEIA